VREAKRRSSWAAPNAEYEEAMQAFAREALRSDRFLSSFLPFVQRVARLGVQNSLAQTVGKLTAPGVPDIYQGRELWDLSLVDPDNRRPVDYKRREAEMAELAHRLEIREERLSLFETLMQKWRDGRVKLATIALLLALRREEPDLFDSGDYHPIVIEGDRSDWAFGYVRARGERRLAVLIARYPAHREKEPRWSAVARLPEGRWFDLVRGRYADTEVHLKDWLKPLSFAVLLTQ
jgi:(1->4)-alpha-D-glucan 1-alpha-D-glucosylmutase